MVEADGAIVATGFFPCLLKRDARFDDHGLVEDVHRPDGVHPVQSYDDRPLVPSGNRTAGEARTAAPGHYHDFVLGAGDDHARYFRRCGRARDTDQAALGSVGIVGQIRFEVRRRRQDPLLTENASQQIYHSGRLSTYAQRKSTRGRQPGAFSPGKSGASN
jgi:hypothetical protein